MPPGPGPSDPAQPELGDVHPLASVVERAFPAVELSGPQVPLDDVSFIVTKEHRRFIEFADAVRRDHYIGLCHGPPGVGKTLSARRYACWQEVAPLLRASSRNFTLGKDRDDWHTLLYTPTVSATPRMIDKELTHMGWDFATLRAPDPYDRRTFTDPHGLPAFVELLIVDEVDRLKTTALEQLRDHYDRSRFGMILIGMPGIEKRLARYPQLYSRIGFVHQYRPLSPEELTFVLRHHWHTIGLTLAADDFTDAEALAAVHRITMGNFRLVQRLFSQITRILEINGLRTITKEVVETARESLVIGTL
ncbi:AAA family ATPase [Acrocarpospora sp. B8E8]|uniref:AAA family ATPase n=1 Tax=Acrocarpospora sp. B8E8 TaxID=3153572 RepID=UPI00325E29BC